MVVEKETLTYCNERILKASNIQRLQINQFYPVGMNLRIHLLRMSIFSALRTPQKCHGDEHI